MNLYLLLFGRRLYATAVVAFLLFPTAKVAEATGAEPAPVSREELRAGMWAYFGPGPSDEDAVDPRLEIVEKRDRGDHERWVLRYQLHENDTGYAYLMLPRPAPRPGEKLPLVLALHPTSLLGKDRVAGNYEEPPADEAERVNREARQYALDLVRRGFVVFAPDRAGFGQRRLLDNPEATVRQQMDAYTRHIEERWPGWRLTSGKTVWDLRRALDFLPRFKFIDMNRVAAIGHSLGSWDSLMLAAMDDRVTHVVANSGGMVAFRKDLWEDPAALRAYLAEPGTQGLRGNVNVFLMLIAPRPVIYNWSLDDSLERGQPNILEGMRTVHSYYRKEMADEEISGYPPFNIYFHGSGHDFPPEARAMAYTWLEQQLDVARRE